jgi:hypothetical protein
VALVQIDEESEEFMECVYKKELGTDLEKVDDGVAVGLIDFTQDSEYKRLLKIQAKARGEKDESKFDEKVMERKGTVTCPTETIGQNTEEDIC